jgi:hypothetical protein
MLLSAVSTGAAPSVATTSPPKATTQPASQSEQAHERQPVHPCLPCDLEKPREHAREHAVSGLLGISPGITAVFVAGL